MPKYNLTVTVDYEFEVEAENEDDAGSMAWAYEDHKYMASIYSVDVELIEDDDVIAGYVRSHDTLEWRY